MTSDAIIQIEKKLGRSLFAAFDSIDGHLMEIIITVLWGAFQSLEADFTLEDAAGLVDQYISDDDHSLMGLMCEVASILETAGIFIKGWDWKG